MTQATEPPAGPGVVPEVDWRRLDPKMLLVHPVSEVARLAVPLLVVVFVGSGGGFDGWHLAVVAIPVALGLWRYATTQFRITAEHLELRAGLVGRHVTRARLDKVRTVALDASPIHRVLSLAKVRIGTGDDEGLELNALSTGEARALRASLLHRAGEVPVGESGGIGGGIPGPPVAAEDEVLLTFDPRWLRLAPFTGTGLAIAAGALGAGSGVLRDSTGDIVESALDRAGGTPLVLLVVGGTFVVGIGLVVLSVVGYALTNWGFRFSRDRAGRSWHLTRGLLTTRETSVDTARVRGITVCRPAGLRLVGGGSARALVTGVHEEHDTGAVPIAPAAPYDVVHGLCRAVAGDDAALDDPLLEHGPRARRRQLVRALRTVLLLVLVVLVATVLLDLAWWVPLLPLVLLPVAVALARDRYRGLGHLLTAHHLVAGQPRVSRHRTLLLRRGVIGWQLHQSWFQRRRGLVTLVATTAAGDKAYPIVDVDEAVATALALEAVPGLAEQFVSLPAL